MSSPSGLEWNLRSRARAFNFGLFNVTSRKTGSSSCSATSSQQGRRTLVEHIPCPILLTARSLGLLSFPSGSTASSSRKNRILSPEPRKYSSPTCFLLASSSSPVVNLVFQSYEPHETPLGRLNSTKGCPSRLNSSRCCLDLWSSVSTSFLDRNSGSTRYLER